MAKSPSRPRATRRLSPQQLRPVTTLDPAKAASAALEKARRATERQPEDASAWRHYGLLLARSLPSRPILQQAETALTRALELDPQTPEPRGWLALVLYRLGDSARASEQAQWVLAEQPEQPHALWAQAYLDSDAGRRQEALAAVERALAQGPREERHLQELRGQLLSDLGRLEEAALVYKELLVKSPKNWSYWNNLGTVYRDLSDLPASEDAYRRAIEGVGQLNATPYSNLVTLSHYDPAKSREQLYALSQEWQTRYAPTQIPERPRPDDRSSQRPLRIGMYSDGFRAHPVGHMIGAALARLHPDESELVLYPTHPQADAITRALQRYAVQWTPVHGMSDDEFYEQLIEDRIDILFDLAGHNRGTRARVIARQPAPLIVKWVGGLINTTGIHAIDYLLSDAIETPLGAEEDAFYNEKLIRLPDDYIVYHPPPYTPPVGPLPALKQGTLTLGCFNNPTKLNPELTHEWSQLLHALPGSRLLLKGKAFDSEPVYERMRAAFAAEGIDGERLLLEGFTPHHALLNTYNRVDIALDTWPYSGGLTTCEALLMGVPVVTLPGPTFAGRHSATHLTNAGLPELVVSSWDEYRARVIELASDLDSLATIRQHLRQVLRESPVCDSQRFARHFMIAMRAIWQRYCEDKPPAALTLDKQGQAWFDGEAEPIRVSVPEPLPLTRAEALQLDAFNWQLPSKLVVLDNSSKLLRGGALPILLKTGAFGIVAFDPQSQVEQPERFTNTEQVQLFRHALLGDGQPTTLYACLEPRLSSTLAPLPAEQLPPEVREGARVLTQLPIQTIGLDQIEGLESLDWLLLDGLSDAATILEHGTQALKNGLLIEVHIAFERTHQRQPSLDEISYWASRNGYRFYCFHDIGRRSHLPERDDLLKKQSSELIVADALFIPSVARLAELTNEQCLKLAFLLHTIYGIRDLSHELLTRVDADKAEAYLIAEGIVKRPVEEGLNEAEAEGNIMVDAGGGAVELDEMRAEELDAEAELEPDAASGTESAPIASGEPEDEFVFD
ncbi:MAG: tetratricopeptide repeat protein [Lamprobacter sp.]|uniref:O-linked N-acetylglucosamine transferase, SPINDLY family protein n=1 Tax=Lamprobacter sp. TaxID=3100796 RepID=UPI002B25A125|nr:tetratricopeptide repeat protein [Lamprobacter sp.]MEA3642812.1 tetratricopeptide repeat protein [Lamprobacter sp.]